MNRMHKLRRNFTINKVYAIKISNCNIVRGSISTLRCLIEWVEEGGGGEFGINGRLEKVKKPNRRGGLEKTGCWKMIPNVINEGLGV